MLGCNIWYSYSNHNLFLISLEGLILLQMFNVNEQSKLNPQKFHNKYLELFKTNWDWFCNKLPSFWWSNQLTVAIRNIYQTFDMALSALTASLLSSSKVEDWTLSTRRSTYNSPNTFILNLILKWHIIFDIIEFHTFFLIIEPNSGTLHHWSIYKYSSVFMQ